MKTVIITLVVLIVGAVIAVPTVVYSGLFNVAATWRDPAPVAWLLHSTYANSVAVRADEIQVPENLGGRERVLQGARNFMAMCSGCHTPPGKSKTPVSTGLNPPPPDLAEVIPHRTLAEAFWVIKNGVRMTGMPAFGPTHKDEELWALVAFLDQMSEATPEAYNTLVAQAKRSAPADDGHGHRHGSEAETVDPGGHDSASSEGHGGPGHHDAKSEQGQTGDMQGMRMQGNSAAPKANEPASPSHGAPGHHDEKPATQPPPADDGHDHQH
ncbi:MAG: cytochrome c [Salinisphaeraceae bacterium]